MTTVSEDAYELFRRGKLKQAIALVEPAAAGDIDALYVLVCCAWEARDLRTLAGLRLADIEPAGPREWTLRLFDRATESIATSKPYEEVADALAAIEWAEAHGSQYVKALAHEHIGHALTFIRQWEIPYGDGSVLEPASFFSTATEAYTHAGHTEGALRAALALFDARENPGLDLLEWITNIAIEDGLSEFGMRAAMRGLGLTAAEGKLTAAMAEEWLEKATSLCRTFDNDLLRAEAVTAVCPYLARRRDTWHVLKDAREAFEKENHWRGMFRAEMALGAWFRGDNEDLSQEYYTDAVLSANRMGDAVAECRARVEEAEAFRRLGRFGDAFATIETALTRPIPVLLEATMLMTASRAAARRFDIGRASEAARMSTDLFRTFDNRARVGDACEEAGEILCGASDALTREALQYWDEALEIARSHQDADAGVRRVARRSRGILALPAWDRARDVRTARESLAPARKSAAGNLKLLAAVHFAEAELDLDAGSPERALEGFEIAVAAYAASDDPDGAALARLRAGMVRLTIADPDDRAAVLRAEKDLDRAQHRFEFGGAREHIPSAALFGAMACRRLIRNCPNGATGRYWMRKARRRIREAIERCDSNLTHVVMTTAKEAMTAQLGLRAQTAALYDYGVRLELELRNPAGALEALERLKARSLADALRNLPLPAPDIDPLYMSRERELREEIAKPHADRKWRHVNAQLLELWLGEIARQTGEVEYANLRKGVPPSWDEIRTWLAKQDGIEAGPRLVAVSYFVSGEDVYAIVARSGHRDPVESRVNLSRAALRQLADEWVATGIGSHRASRILRDLRPLIEPAIRESAPDDVLCFIPSDFLYALPLHAIPHADDEPLLARNIIRYAPSLATLRYLTARRGATVPETAHVFGDAGNDLPASRVEAFAVGQWLGAEVTVGEDVTADALAGALQSCGTVHFAGHAEFYEADPRESGLVVTGGKRLSVSTILELEHAVAATVVLNGCDTATHDVRAGDEIVGLTRAFLYTGVTTLIATLWRVRDEPSAEVMRIFYQERRQRNLAAPDALRKAMLHVRNDPRWQHPQFWAAYVVFGG